MNNQEQVRRYTRARNRKRVLDVDLNAAPPCESRSQEGTSSLTRSLDNQAALEGDTPLPPPIDLEAFDDDVIISSPRAFAEAINNSIRSRRHPVVVDVESEERLSRKRRRVPANQPIINCELYINIEGNSKKTDVLPPVAPPPLPPKDLELTCPICMGKLVEETSTKCGHIFCKGCIKAALAAQSKCPTCRKRITNKDTIRIYLPATRIA